MRNGVVSGDRSRPFFDLNLQPKLLLDSRGALYRYGWLRSNVIR